MDRRRYGISCASALSSRNCACCRLRPRGKIWCIDTLRVGSLDPLMPVLTAASARKADSRRAPGLGGGLSDHPPRDVPGVRYPDRRRLHRLETPSRLCGTGQDPARREHPQGPDPHRLVEAAAVARTTGIRGRRCPVSRRHRSPLSARLSDLKREHWVAEDCLALEDQRLYEPDPAQAWARLRGLAQLAAEPRARAKAIAVWREKLARARDLPRAWILADAAIFSIAQGLRARRSNDSLAASLQGALEDVIAGRVGRPGAQPGCAPDSRAESADRTPEQNRRCARRGTQGERRDSRAARRTQGARDGQSARFACPRRAGAGRKSERGCSRLSADANRRTAIASDALEHRVHIGVGVHDAQQSRRLVVLDQRLGLRLVHLQPLADDFFLVVRPLDQAMRFAALLGMRPPRAARYTR